MGVTSYYSYGGEILGEESSGTRRDYLTDALGSVIATVTGAGTVENTYRYKPYGEQLAKTGVGSDPKFLWNGKSGYRVIGNETYVRMRSYKGGLAIWTSVDPLWPIEMAYAYTNMPVLYVDFKGTVPGLDDTCKLKINDGDQAKVSSCLSNLCAKLGDENFQKKINQCADKVGLGNPDAFICLSNWCINGNSIGCTSEPHLERTGGRYCEIDDKKFKCKKHGCPDRMLEVPVSCARNNCEWRTPRETWTSVIKICTLWQDIRPECDNLNGMNCYLVDHAIVHELTHMCFKCLNGEKEKYKDFEKKIEQLANCISEKAGCRVFR